MLNFTNAGDFSITTSLFDNKNVMVIVPHQDDDINLVGGLIEQYTENGSNVSVVFSTNGDYAKKEEIRAAEAVNVLTELGVKKENIYYLGFADQWTVQIHNGQKICHIYDSIDVDKQWTSHCGKIATYGTQSIDCYLKLPYTRNNFLYSLQSIIEEKMPDTIFAVDFDDHVDHRATSLLFEEAMNNILKVNKDYHPTVYKGFCYGTAWFATKDFFDNINLLSTKKPDDKTWNHSSFGYIWENRSRFPMSVNNINPILSNNSVYNSLSKYSSQHAVDKAECILNGDKVFWERRTDSLLYNAEIFVNDSKTHLLNDFKLKDFADISSTTPKNIGFKCINNGSIQININDIVKANCLYLYDNPDQNQNILKGYILFDDGSQVDFGELEKLGNATKISFEERKLDSIKIVITESEGEFAGLSEIELYYDTQKQDCKADCFLMATDENANFIYNSIIYDNDAFVLKIYSFPNKVQLGAEDINLSIKPSDNTISYYWKNDALVIKCPKGEKCAVTVYNHITSTTFSVANLSKTEYLYIKYLIRTEQVPNNIKTLYKNVKEYILHFSTGVRNN